MDETWLEKTEQYVSGEMSPEERSRFESEMSVNGELLSYVNLYKNIETVMRNQEKYDENEAALKGSLKNLNTLYFNDQKDDAGIKKISGYKEKEAISQPKNNRRTKTWKVLLIAAVTIGIISVSIFWYLDSAKENKQVAGSAKKADTGAATIKQDTVYRQTDTASGIAKIDADTNASRNIQLGAVSREKQEALFAGNFKPDTIPEITEGPLEDAFALYRENEYAEAAEEFANSDLNKITRGLQADPKLTSFYADYYAGISYLAIKEPTKAIVELNKALSKAPGESYKVKVQWYLALAYLKDGDLENAKELLNNISSNNLNTEHKLQADELVRQIR